MAFISLVCSVHMLYYRYAKMLYEDSNWSKATYAYLAVASMCMMQDELTEEEKQEQAELAK